jgi:hypothetical protein
MFASLVDIVWDWEPADEEITNFRYRLGDEPWLVVDSSVSEYTLSQVDDSQSYTFEIQQTYDGENYSESSIMSFEPKKVMVEEPMVIEEPVTIDSPVVDQQLIVIDQQPLVIDEEPVTLDTPVIEQEPLVIDQQPLEGQGTEDFVATEEVTTEAGEPLIEAPTSGIKKLEPPTEDDELIEAFDSNPWMGIEFFIGAGGKSDNLVFTSIYDPNGVYLPLRTMILPTLSFDFVYGNILTFDNGNSSNLRVGLGYNRYQKSSDSTTVLGPDIHASISYEYKLSSTISLEGLGGLSVMFTGEDISSDTSANIFYGPYVQIMGRFSVNELFSLNLSAETKFLFSNVFTPYELTGIVRAGFTYRF